MRRRQRMIHKKTLAKVGRFQKILYFELAILVILTLGIIFQKLFISQPYQVSQNTEAKKIASAPAQLIPSPKPTPTSLPIPTQSGRSVTVPILLYHYIGNNPNPADKARNTLSTAPDKLDEQMGFLASQGYTPITLMSLYTALKNKDTLPPKPVVLTFDDGYIDFYVNAFPILRKYSFHAVSFIPTGLIGGGYYMTWSQIKEIQSSGLVEFDAHTVNHVSLPALSPERQQYQIFQSKKDLETQVGVPVNFFAYPYGTSNQVSWDLVKKAGFLGAVGTWYGRVESEGTQYDWPRIRISGGLSLNDFAKKI